MVSAPFARSRSLLAGHRDLLGKIRRRIDVLGAFDVEVGHEHHLQAVARGGITVDDLTDRRDQAANELSQMIAGCGLAAEDEGAGRRHPVGDVFDLDRPERSV